MAQPYIGHRGEKPGDRRHDAAAQRRGTPADPRTKLRTIWTPTMLERLFATPQFVNVALVGHTHHSNRALQCWDND